MTTKIKNAVMALVMFVAGCTERPIDLLETERHSGNLSGTEITERLETVAKSHRLKIRTGTNAAGAYVQLETPGCFYAIQGYTDRFVSLDAYRYSDTQLENCAPAPAYDAIRAALSWSI